MKSVAIRSLNDLRSKARKTLEQQASDIERRNPRGAEQLRVDARHIENWGREAEEGLVVSCMGVHSGFGGDLSLVQTMCGFVAYFI